MIPRLFAPQSPTEASFATPIAVLSDTLSCIVTEERNGIFTLEMEYPIGGNAWDKIELGGFIVVRTSTDPAYNPQPFQIKKINRAIGGRVRIQAEHLTYALNGIVIKPPIASAAPMTTMNWLNRQAIGMGNFTLGTDIPATTLPSNPARSDYYTQFTSKSVMDCIVGDDASFVSYFGGEIYRNGNELLVLKERGKDNGVSIRYGKNLVSLSQTIATNDYYTEIFPYCKAAESTNEWIPAFITLTEEVLPILSVSYAGVSKTLPVDLSDKVPENPTEDDLRTASEDYLNHYVQSALPNNIEISFVELHKTLEYKELAPLQTVALCDTVTVVCGPFGISQKMKVVRTVYDALLDRYNSIQVGELKKTLADTILKGANR